MHIGEVIRNYRKMNNLTQDEVAKRLGITAPAVNKWENGNSQPDIMLLSPIARMFHISLDTLLSFREILTEQEINQMISEMESKLKCEAYEDVFRWAKSIMEQYPNCEQLIWQMAVVLDAWCNVKEIPNTEQYEDFINACYIRTLESDDEKIRYGAADSLFNFYLRKEQYEKAEEYLAYFSNQNPERKRKQAVIYSKTNRLEEAYKAYEEILFSGYQITNMVLVSLYSLVMREGDRNKAQKLVQKQVKLAELFEMGKYHEISCELDFATAEKDVDKTIEVMEGMASSVEQISDFTNSMLYEHMEFRPVGETFGKELLVQLRECFKDEETYGYLKNDDRWEKLIK